MAMALLMTRLMVIMLMMVKVTALVMDGAGDTNGNGDAQMVTVGMLVIRCWR